MQNIFTHLKTFFIKIIANHDINERDSNTEEKLKSRLNSLFSSLSNQQQGTDGHQQKMDFKETLTRPLSSKVFFINLYIKTIKFIFWYVSASTTISFSKFSSKK